MKDSVCFQCGKQKRRLGSSYCRKCSNYMRRKQIRRNKGEGTMYEPCTAGSSPREIAAWEARASRVTEEAFLALRKNREDVQS